MTKISYHTVFINIQPILFQLYIDPEIFEAGQCGHMFFPVKWRWFIRWRRSSV